MLDLESGHVTPHFVKGTPFQGPMPTHHVLPVNRGQAVAVTDVGANSVDFFDPGTGKIVAKVSVGPQRKQHLHNPDGLLYEPKSQLLIAVAGDSSSLSLIDTTAFAKRGEISIGKGKLETAVADGTGLVYVNEEATHSIAVIDIGKRKLLRQLVLKDCEEPTGMAFDPKDQLVISVCSNGIAKFVSLKTLREVASVKVGAGADGVIYDAERGYAFTFGGDEGTLSIIAVRDPNSISLVQTLTTRPSARLGALDPRTGRLYIPAAVFGPPAAPFIVPGLGSLPGLNPHTFEFLVVAPRSP